MSNSQILVFYSERHTVVYGYATNWNSTGYFDAYSSVGK